MPFRTTWRYTTLVGLALLGAACERPVEIAGPGTSPAQLIVSPKNAALHSTQSIVLTAVALTSGGDTASATVSWSVTSGTGSVTDTSTSGGRHYGRYKAGADTGKFKVIATGQPGGKSDTSVVTVTPVPVASVTVSPATASMQAGATAQLGATTLDSTGLPLSGRTISWATSNAAVTTVSGSGLVSGVGVGTATITATSEGKSGSAAITVSAVPVASVTVSPATASVQVGGTAQLTATPKDASGTPVSGRVVTWATSNAAVATVSGSGLVSGAAAGTATITATSEGQSGTAAITVSVVPVASVTVSPASASVATGATVQLAATPKDASGTPLSGRVVTWATSNAAVATVSGSGLVSGAAAGTATITATSEGQSGTAAITVSVVPVASVAVSPAAASLTVGQAVQLTATPKDAAGNVLTGRVVTWATSNGAIATVSASGLVTGNAAGAATITATSEGQNGTATVTVTNVPVASVTVSPATASVTVGQAVQLAAIPKDAAGNVLTGRVVTWATSNGAIATVSASGLVTGATAGAVTITATSEGQNGTATVTVTNMPVASVTVSPATASVPVGQAVQLAATPKDAAGNVLTGRVVTWATSNASVAGVSAGGLVTGGTAGTVTITATSEGQSGTASVSVAAASATWAHEPAGLTAILNQPWTTDVPPMTGQLTGNHVLVTDQTAAPVSPSSAMDFWYPAGLVAGFEEMGLLWFHVPTAQIGKEIFIGVAFKLSSAFQGEASGVQKLFFLSAHGTGANDFWVEVGGSGSNPLNLRVVTEFQGLASAEYEPNVKNFLSTPVAGETNVIVDRGVWHKYEIYLKLPDVSGGAGTCMIWVDGTLALNRDPSLPLDRAMPMAFSGTGWAELNVDPIWGGGGSVKAHRDDIWYDHLYISTR